MLKTVETGMVIAALFVSITAGNLVATEDITSALTTDISTLKNTKLSFGCWFSCFTKKYLTRRDAEKNIPKINELLKNGTDEFAQEFRVRVAKKELYKVIKNAGLDETEKIKLLAKKLAQSTLDKQSQNRIINSALLLAATKYPNMVLFLISCGADVNYVEKKYSYYKNAKEKDYTISTILESKLTPLHQAVNNNDLSIVKILIEHGATIHETDIDGDTVLDRANYNDDTTIRDYLMLVADFYKVKEGTMPFGDFALHYLTGPDTDQNSGQIGTILHLCTREFADNFYQWLDNNKKISTTSSWFNGKKFMYLTLMQKSLTSADKLFWLTLCDPYWDSAGFTTSQAESFMKKKISTELSKPKNIPLNMVYTGLKYCNNLKKAVFKKNNRSFSDCTINFTN